jgi:hypothetical protein
MTKVVQVFLQKEASCVSYEHSTCAEVLGHRQIPHFKVLILDHHATS